METVPATLLLRSYTAPSSPLILHHTDARFSQPDVTVDERTERHHGSFGGVNRATRRRPSAGVKIQLTICLIALFNNTSEAPNQQVMQNSRDAPPSPI
jgi:hypothetical protein